MINLIEPTWFRLARLRPYFGRAKELRLLEAYLWLDTKKIEWYGVYVITALRRK